jgi:N-acetyltransferase
VTGRIVRLEPLAPKHENGLRDAAADPAIWEWIGDYGATHADRFRSWFQSAFEDETFVTVSQQTDETIGSTRFLNAQPEHRRVEIGWTWLTPPAWRTGANVEAKLLMLEDAFEHRGMQRVEFKTDARNERSRAALEALPAQFEGIHRKHMQVPGVGVRDSAWYSIVDDEWPAVRANLERRLAAHA